MWIGTLTCRDVADAIGRGTDDGGIGFVPADMGVSARHFADVALDAIVGLEGKGAFGRLEPGWTVVEK